MKLGESLEDYLETILILRNKTGTVRSVDVARFMDFSKPSVCHAVKELRGKGLLVMEQDGELCLTPSGREMAEAVYERHRLFSEVLISLGVEPETAARDACRIEHVISSQSFEKIREAYHAALENRRIVEAAVV